MGKLSKDECVEAVRDQGIVVSGGPGTYVLLGGSDTGKNFLLEHQLEQAYREGLRPSNIVSLSTTSGYNNSLKFLEGLAPQEHYTALKDQKELLFIHKHREQTVTQVKNSDPKWEEWVQRNPLWIILDDFGGTLDMSRSQNNPFYTMITSLRHLGAYMFLLIQYKKAVGPSFFGNLRAICSFDVNADSMKHMADGGGFTKYKKEECVKWMKKPHYFTLWWITWQLDAPKPQAPWFVKKVKPNEPLRINRKFPPQHTPIVKIKRAMHYEQQSPNNEDEEEEEGNGDDDEDQQEDYE